MLTPLITAADLRDLLGPETFMAVFDDLGTGDYDAVAQSSAVALVLREAHVMCVSWLPDLYAKIPDGTDAAKPDLLVTAELAYAKAMSWDRRREYARASSIDIDGLFRRADATMQRIQESKLRITPNDAPPEPVPQNVGGIVRNSGQRLFCENSNGTSNLGDF